MSAPVFSKSIGVTYQMGALFGSMTLLENVRAAPGRIHGPSVGCHGSDRSHETQIGRAGNVPGLYALRTQRRHRNVRPSRVPWRLTRTFSFLDEPSAGLDPITSAELDRLILDLARNLAITFVIVTHELSSI